MYAVTAYYLQLKLNYEAFFLQKPFLKVYFKCFDQNEQEVF